MKTSRSMLRQGSALLLASLAIPVFAPENGNTNWPLGVNSVLPAVLPSL